MLLIVPLFVGPPQVLLMPELTEMLLHLELLDGLVEVKYLSFLRVQFLLQVCEALDILSSGEHIHSDSAVVVLHLQIETIAC